MHLSGDKWIVRHRGDDEVHAVRRHVIPIAAEQSAFQHIEIVSTVKFGRALVLDGVYQSSEFDEVILHETLVHPVMSLFQGNEIDVLIIGGGEGCVAREVLRHRNVRNLYMVELDERVPALCRQHLGWDEGALSSPALKLYFGDAAQVVPRLSASQLFDVVIVDATQPLPDTAAEALLSMEFLGELKRRLRDNGYLVGYGINAAPVGATLRAEIRARTLAAIGGSLVEYAVPCPFYSASLALQVISVAGVPNLKDLVLRKFEQLAVPMKALDTVSMQNYFSIPWGYRIAPPGPTPVSSR